MLLSAKEIVNRRPLAPAGRSWQGTRFHGLIVRQIYETLQALIPKRFTSVPPVRLTLT